MIYKFLSRSEAETRQFAKDLAKKFRKGQILALQGNLGAGKTAFVKGLAQGLKIKKIIRSPTFVLMKIYSSKEARKQGSKEAIKKLVHLDAYRLKNETELEEIGALDYLGAPNTLTAIEWPEQVKNLLKKFSKKIIWIKFDYGKKENERIIKCKR